MAFLKALVQSLISCSSCHENATLETLPLCEDCLISLRNSSMTRFDLGVSADSSLIHSCYALYRLNDKNYEILKAWKKRRGPAFDRVVLKQEARGNILKWLQESEPSSATPSVIVPLPQDPVRTLRLGGSPANVIAKWLSVITGIPVRKMLMPSSKPWGKRQAELDSWHRLQSTLQFEIAPGGTHRAVILVDDFITTGHTACEAARQLRMSGVKHVRVFGLGAEKNPGLLKSA
jgi:predicted amidophosphoribosyltransferase